MSNFTKFVNMPAAFDAFSAFFLVFYMYTNIYSVRGCLRTKLRGRYSSERSTPYMRSLNILDIPHNQL